MRHRDLTLAAAPARTRGVLGPTRPLIFAILLACFALGAAATAGATTTAPATTPAEAQLENIDPWADHPALEQFNVSGKTLPATLYLVRTPDGLRKTEGLVIHGAHNSLYLVSGDPKVVAALAQQERCAVFPLESAPAPRAITPRSGK